VKQELRVFTTLDTKKIMAHSFIRELKSPPCVLRY